MSEIVPALADVEALTLREYLAGLSRTRRAVRALKAIHGETRVYSVLTLHRPIEKPSTVVRNAVGWRVAMIREQRNRRFLRAQENFASLLAAQDHVCYLCSDPFTRDDPPSRDHVHPRSRRGGEEGNILLAHDSCNGRKGDRLPTPRELRELARVNAKLALDI